MSVVLFIKGFIKSSYFPYLPLWSHNPREAVHTGLQPEVTIVCSNLAQVAAGKNSMLVLFSMNFNYRHHASIV